MSFTATALILGAPLVEHPNNGVLFTGGTSTGERVAASAAPQFKKLSLELGGKNASVVLADCELQKTVEAGSSVQPFLNQGQICLCGSRILVERSIYAFVMLVLERVQG